MTPRARSPRRRLKGELKGELSPEERKDKYLKERYGLSYRQYKEMLFQQKGLCKICLRPPKAGGLPLRVDHDHKGANRVRGLLCHRCNYRLLGRGLEDPFLHQAAVDYLLSSFDGRLL